MKYFKYKYGSINGFQGWIIKIGCYINVTSKENKVNHVICDRTTTPNSVVCFVILLAKDVLL